MTDILKKQVQQNTTKQEVKVSFFLGFTVFLMLAVFQPFGTYSWDDPAKMILLAGYGIVIGFTYFTLAMVLPLIFKKFYQKENWTYGKEMFHILMVLLITITATFIYRNEIINASYSLNSYFFFLGIASVTSIFPMSIIFLIRYMQVKNKPVIVYQPAVAEVPQKVFLNVEGENKNEKVKFAKEELLFIKASDNYVVLHLNKDGKIVKHMLRSSLSKIATQVADEDIFQVHRSYLVNLENVKTLSGKSPNYVLELKSSKEEIPVSRTKVKMIRAQLQKKPI